jgi:hypothetical protein
MAQVFPEGPPLVVIQVGRHQRKERLGGQHDELALRTRHGPTAHSISISSNVSGTFLMSVTCRTSRMSFSLL